MPNPRAESGSSVPKATVVPHAADDSAAARVWQCIGGVLSRHPSLLWRVPLGVLALWLLRRRVQRTARRLMRDRPAGFFLPSNVPPYAAQSDSLPQPLWPTQLLYSLLHPVRLLQHGLLRDSGGFRLLADGGALLGGALAFGWRPGVASAFAGLGENASGRSLGIEYSRPAGASLKLDVFHAHRTANGAGNKATAAAPSPVLVFTHGGAWGSGFRQLYRLFAVQLDVQLRYVVVVPGYRVYPSGRVVEQVEDVQAALQWTRAHAHEFGGDASNITLMGHSSGAHISSMAMLQTLQKLYPAGSGAAAAATVPPTLQPVLPTAFIGVSGVYDIGQHYDFEAARGVHEVSPMKAAAGGEVTMFPLVSATRIAAELSEEQRRHLPPVLLLHGLSDHTVPYAQSVRMAYALAGALPMDHIQLADDAPRAVRLAPLESHTLYHAAEEQSSIAGNAAVKSQAPAGRVHIGDSLTFVPAAGAVSGMSRPCPLVQLRMCGSARDPALQDHATALLDLMQPRAASQQHGPGHARWMSEAIAAFVEAVQQRSQIAIEEGTARPGKAVIIEAEPAATPDTPQPAARASEASGELRSHL